MPDKQLLCPECHRNTTDFQKMIAQIEKRGILTECGVSIKNNNIYLECNLCHNRFPQKHAKTQS